MNKIAIYLDHLNKIEIKKHHVYFIFYLRSQHVTNFQQESIYDFIANIYFMYLV